MRLLPWIWFCTCSLLSRSRRNKVFVYQNISTTSHSKFTCIYNSLETNTWTKWHLQKLGVKFFFKIFIVYLRTALKVKLTWIQKRDDVEAFTLLLVTWQEWMQIGGFLERMPHSKKGWGKLASRSTSCSFPRCLGWYDNDTIRNTKENVHGQFNYKSSTHSVHRTS